MKQSTLNRILILWTVAWVAMLLSGCTTAWTGEAVNIIALLGPAITSLLGILSAFGLGIPPTALAAFEQWSATATTALQEVKALIDQYNTAEASAQPGLLVEIQTALATISSNLKTILPTLKITDVNTQAKIEAVFEAFQSELTALISLVPALKGEVKDHGEMKALIQAVLPAKEFRARFNAAAALFGERYKI